MEYIDSHEVARRMREAADIIDRHDTIPMDWEMDLSCHRIDTKEKLVGWLRMMTDLEAFRNGSSHWIDGKIGSVDVTIFYSAGLLAPTRRKKFGTVVEESGEPDFAKLLAETEPVTPDSRPSEVAVDL